MDRPYRRRVRTPSPYGSPVNLRGVEREAERGAIGGGRNFVYHHHHYHHHHSRRPSPSPSPPRHSRHSPSARSFRHYSRERARVPFGRRSPASRDSSLRRGLLRRASPIPRDRRADTGRPSSPRLPPIVVRRNRSTPPRAPLQVRPASVSSIASSFLFPRPISPVRLSLGPTPALAPPVQQSAAPVAEASAEPPRSSSAIEKSVAERPFDEIPEGEGSSPSPPLPSTGHQASSAVDQDADPLTASIDETQRLLGELSVTIQSFGPSHGPLHSSPRAPVAGAPQPASPPFDWDSLSGLVPVSDDDSDSFRSDSSYIPEQVNRSRSELSLLIRSELFNILDGGVDKNDAWRALLKKFLEEACSSAAEFRALFTFACDTASDETFEEGFRRICDEVLRS